MKQLIQKYQKLNHHYLLTHHPWLWEMQVIQVGRFSLAYNLIVLIDIIIIEPEYNTKSLIWTILLGLISACAFFWWMYQQRSYNLINHYGKTHEKVGQDQFWISFIITTLLFAPPFLLYNTSLVNVRPYLSSDMTDIYINVGMFGLLSLYASMAVLLWKLIGLSKFFITAALSLLSAISVIFIVKVHLVILFIPIFCCIAIILLSLRVEWKLKIPENQFFIPITYLDIFIHILSPILYFIARLIILFIPLAIVFGMLGYSFSNIFFINILLSLTLTLRKYSTKTFPQFRKEYLSHSSRPRHS